MSEVPKYSWLTAYQAALLEADPVRLRDLVITAERALEQRALELLPHLVDHRAERRALEDARVNLRVLARELRNEPRNSRNCRSSTLNAP
jgi:hypothetical protein